MHLFDKPGITVNVQKSVLVPGQEIYFLWFISNSVTMTVKLTTTKQIKMQNMGDMLLRRESCTLRDLSSFIWDIVAGEPGLSLTPLRYRSKHLKIEITKMLRARRGDYDAIFTLSHNAVNMYHGGFKIFTMTQNICYHLPLILNYNLMHHKWIGGNVEWLDHWWSLGTGRNFTYHCFGAKSSFSLQTLCTNVNSKHIRLHIDNTTAVMCVNKCGSIKNH